MKNWQDVYADILKEEKMVELRDNIKKQRLVKTILPKGEEVLNAFKLCPFEKLKLVIVSQDPYPSAEHAHGLAFSSNADKTPASLNNIFTEIHKQLYNGEPDCFQSNNLTSWAQQGVLLLNRVLTVVEGDSNSHQNLGWEYFTTKVIQRLSHSYPRRLIFVLWGNNAQEVINHINPEKHYIIKGVHPSPLSANKGFFDNGHFIEIQTLLRNIFFESLRDIVTDQYDWSELAGFIKEWLSINNIESSEENLTTAIKFMNGRIGEFLAMNDPRISKLYELNFKT